MTELLKVNRLQRAAPSTLAQQNSISRITDVGFTVETMLSFKAALANVIHLPSVSLRIQHHYRMSAACQALR